MTHLKIYGDVERKTLDDKCQKLLRSGFAFVLSHSSKFIHQTVAPRNPSITDHVFEDCKKGFKGRLLLNYL